MLRKQSFSSLALLICFFGAHLVSAATYTVKAGGGGDFVNIQSCIDAMSAGDTCTVYAGTYSGSISISAGTVGSYKTVNINPGDTVTIDGGVTINSHTKVIGFRIAPANFSPACVSVTAGATDWYVTNNTMTQCGRSTGEAISEPGSTTSYGYIQGNKISYPCTNSSLGSNGGPCAAMFISGSHHLIENNDISHVSDGVTRTQGSYNVYRNNVQHDTSESECNLSPVHGGNCHIDFISSEPTITTQYGLYEGNVLRNNTGSNSHVFLAQGDGCGGGATCNNLIIRYNAGYNFGTYWLLNDVGAFNHVKDYNNTVSSVQSPPENLLSFLSTNTFGAAKNNLWYNASQNNTEWYAVDANTGFSDGHNLAYLSSCGTSCGYRTYGAGGFGMGHQGVGNITNQDPMFVNATSDWHLQAGSPAIAAGGPLTTAVGAGTNSTTLSVADADYFQDGMGLTAVGVQPDWIRIGASTTVQIASVNYSAKTITLASPVSWTAGSPVYLFKDSAGKNVLSGSAPDLGAFPYAESNTPPGGPPAPSKLVVVVR